MCPTMIRYVRCTYSIMKDYNCMDQRGVSTNAAHRRFERVWRVQHTRMGLTIDSAKTWVGMGVKPSLSMTDH